MLPGQHSKNIKFIGDVINEKIQLSIEIIDNNNKVIGCLKPITRSTINDEFIIKKLTKLRNDAMQFFLTQFIATHRRTKNWLANTVLNDNKRILFIIYDNSGNIIGNYGFTKLNESSTEIDNLIRGESFGDPRIIFYAERALIKWLFEKFKLDEIVGYIFSDNILPMLLHKEIGFSVKEKLPLAKKVINNEIYWNKVKNGDVSKADKYQFKISINQEDFMRKNKL